MDILVEKINVSDDKFLLSKLFVSNGDRITKGTKIYTIESSKAVIEVEAPCDGYIFFNHGVEEMEQYPVGFCVAKLVDTLDNPFAKETASVISDDIKTDVRTLAKEVTDDTIPDNLVITSAALQLMKVHGIKANRFNHSFVSKGDVLRLINGVDDCYKGNDIVIVGGGGFGKMQIDAIHENRNYNIIGILDKDIEVGNYVYGYKVLGGDEMLPLLYKKGLRLAVNSVGSIAASQEDSRFTLRMRLANKIKSMGYIIPNIIHPKAIVESSVKMGEGNVIMAGAYIGSDAVLGDNCLINNHAIISHDCILGNCVRVSPNATLAGSVRVGDNSLVGMNTSVYIGVEIGKDVIVFNGMNVFGKVPDNSILK